MINVTKPIYQVIPNVRLRSVILDPRHYYRNALDKGNLTTRDLEYSLHLYSDDKNDRIDWKENYELKVQEINENETYVKLKLRVVTTDGKRNSPIDIIDAKGYTLSHPHNIKDDSVADVMILRISNNSILRGVKFKKVLRHPFPLTAKDIFIAHRDSQRGFINDLGNGIVHDKALESDKQLIEMYKA